MFRPHRAFISVLSATLLVSGFSASLFATDAESIRKLRGEFKAAFARNDLDTAIRVGLDLDKLDPNNAAHQYNLAGAYARNGNVSAALVWISKSAENGFSDVQKVTTDPDFASVQSDPGFRAALERITRNHEESEREFVRALEKTSPIVFVPTTVDPQKAAPLIVALHGYGSNANDMIDAWKKTAIEFQAILAAPKAVIPTGGSGYSWGTPDQARRLVRHQLDEILRDNNVDREQIVLTGFSQGGYMTYQIGLEKPEEFRGLIPIAARYDETVPSPSVASGGKSPRVFVMVGSDDHVAADNDEASQKLKTSGYRVQLNTYNGVGHELPPKHHDEFRKALQFILMPD